MLNEPVIVSIEYSGKWEGGYGDANGDRVWNGQGACHVLISQMNEGRWTLYAYAKKVDDADGIMVVAISTPNGKTLARSETRRIHGQVIIGWSSES